MTYKRGNLLSKALYAGILASIGGSAYHMYKGAREGTDPSYRYGNKMQEKYVKERKRMQEKPWPKQSLAPSEFTKVNR